MIVAVNARHMDVTDPIREYVESKIAKLPRYYDNVHSIETVLEIEANQPKVEIVVQAGRKHTFVATHRCEDMYAAFDQALDKMTSQLRRFKDRVRDRHGPTHAEVQEQIPPESA